MRKLFLVVFMPFYLQAQDMPIGSWKSLLSYKNPSYIAEAENKIYCVASGSLFYINKSDNTINRLSKTTGLSDIGVKKIGHSKELNVTIIIYENCNIDILRNEEIINIPDIKRKDIAGAKSINNITLKNEIAYLSSSFGLILIDLDKIEVKDTYGISYNEAQSINGCAISGDSILVATNSGLYYANSNSLFLSDFNNWELLENDYENYDNVISTSTGFYADTDSSTLNICYSNNTLIKIKINSLEIHTEEDGGSFFELTNEKFDFIKHALIDENGILWVADSANGLLKFINYDYQESYMPESPKENRIFSLEFSNNRLYVCHGGHVNFGTFWNKNGVSMKDNFDYWRNYDYYELNNARDIVSSASLANKTYFASYYNGIVELEDNEVVERYSWWNTNNGLDTIPYWQEDNKMAISDLTFDKSGNLWGLLSGVENPLFVKTAQNEWHKFSISSTQTYLFDEMLIDDYNQKWGIIGRDNGVFVYNDNNTIENLDDDEYVFLNTNVGDGNLPSMNVLCFANDLDGRIWVGTDKGVAVFYNPASIFSGYNFDAQKILITEGDYGQYLLSEETVTCIAIDGANRKWIGTEKSGVFLLSSEGEEEILHFTKENSPLFSNNIVDITINNNNGEVFIATENGLLSYRSDATKGASLQGEAFVFPNPVTSKHLGPIAISGLITNASVKITDVSGNLIFETTANGGQAVWNGKNKTGKRASSGVYLVLSTDISGKETIVSKILFVN